MDPEVPLFLVCLAMSAFFSGSETALLSASRLRLRRMAAEHDAGAKLVLELVGEPRRLLAGILVGNNIFNVLAAAAATSWCLDRFPPGVGVAVATAFSTVLLVLFSEYLPKTLAALKPIVFARRVARPVRWMLYALTPVVIPLEAVTRPLSALLGKGRDLFGLAEVKMAVAEGVRTGAVDPRLARILHGGLSLEWKSVGDILVPRVDVVAVEAEAGFAECLEVFRINGFSRVLVMDKTQDDDLGYLAAKDLPLLDDAARAEWTARSTLREALRVPASLPLPELLGKMRRSGVHFAVVKDEYGGTEGIVTLEDVLEELVGEIRDEHDVDEDAPLIELSPGRWLVKGEVSVKDLEDRFDLDLAAGDARTVGGLVAEEMGRVPAKGDAVEREKARIVVEAVDEKRVVSVRLSLPRDRAKPS